MPTIEGDKGDSGTFFEEMKKSFARKKHPFKFALRKR